MAEIKEILPCIADPMKYRIIGKIETKEDFKDMIPYIAWLIPNSSYSKKNGWITFMKGGRVITIYPDGTVTMTKTKDKDEAMRTLNQIEQIVKDAYKKKDEIDLSKPKEKISLTPMNAYEYLPKTNCKECGEQTCIAFAIKLLNGEKDFKECKPIFREKKYAGLKETLLGLLTAAGFDIEV